MTWVECYNSYHLSSLGEFWDADAVYVISWWCLGALWTQHVQWHRLTISEPQSSNGQATRKLSEHIFFLMVVAGMICMMFAWGLLRVLVVVVVMILIAACYAVCWQRGNLALHHAAMTGHADIVSLLIAAGSSIDAQDKVHILLLDLAVKLTAGQLCNLCSWIIESFQCRQLDAGLGMNLLRFHGHGPWGQRSRLTLPKFRLSLDLSFNYLCKGCLDQAYCSEMMLIHRQSATDDVSHEHNSMCMMWFKYFILLHFFRWSLISEYFVVIAACLSCVHFQHGNWCTWLCFM